MTRIKYAAHITGVLLAIVGVCGLIWWVPWLVATAFVIGLPIFICHVNWWSR